MKERMDNKIDYKELYYLMQNHTPRTVGQTDLDSRVCIIITYLSSFII
jgi:hypothetical protein